MNGKLKDWSFSRTGESVLTITTRESCKRLWDALGDQEITFSIKKRVIPRSLNANNYAWSLIEKLAVAVKSDKDSVYEEMLRRYGTGETYTDEAGNECKVLFSLREGVPPALVARHYAETGVGYVDGKKFIHYRAIKGTSEYSTKEMSVFLDGFRFVVHHKVSCDSDIFSILPHFFRCEKRQSAALPAVESGAGFLDSILRPGAV